MRISHIQIINMAGFTKFEATLPAVALIEGKNGRGKSSLIDCIKYCYARGHDPDIIHGDETFGEIIIKHDDDSYVRARAARSPKQETVRSWRAPGSKRFEVGRDQIDKIANALSFDPLAFLRLEDKEQVERLLKIMPLEADPHAIEEAVGEAAPEAESAIKRVSAGMNALEVINLIHNGIYEKRRELNVGADTQRKHAQELETAVGADDPTDWGAEYTKLHKEFADSEAVINTRLQEIQDDYNSALAGIDQQVEEQIRAIEKDRTARKLKVAEIARELHNTTASGNQANSQMIAGKVADAKARAEQQQRGQGTKDAAKVARQEAARKEERSSLLTGALDRLTALKTKIAATLPIPGIVISDGRIYREENGSLVPLKKWNTESKIRFCLRLAVLIHGEAGIICLDDAEHFDAEKREGLIKTAKKYAESEKLQFIIGQVADTPLEVKAPA